MSNLGKNLKLLITLPIGGSFQIDASSMSSKDVQAAERGANAVRKSSNNPGKVKITRDSSGVATVRIV